MLLAGASLSALAVAETARGATPAPLSAAWFAAHVDASTGAASAAVAGAATLAQVTTATQNLALLSARLQQMQQAQAAAAAAAHAAAGVALVPNGLATGGLQPAAGATAGSSLWLGASLPTQAVAGGRDEVTVKQTTAKALLTWRSFNVGAKTDLTFDQSAGGSAASTWAVLNKVEDPSGLPSTVLGSIKAPGQVLVLNANGILFGAGAQVNVGSLIASTATISDAQFATGIYGAQSGDSFAPTFTGAMAPVSVAEGAEITTDAPASVTSRGGAVLLLGSTVENDGQIETPDGQAVLAAGEDFILRPGYSTTGNTDATVLGSQVEPAGTKGSAINGSATNAGLIVASSGDITLAAHTVTQAGVAIATSSVGARGTVHLLNDSDDGSGSVTLAPGSVTAVNPDGGTQTVLDSQRAALIAQSAAANGTRGSPASALDPQLGNVSPLADNLSEGRIEIVTGGTAAFDGASLAMAQGGQIAVDAGKRVWIGDGAALDVSGATGAALPMSSNVLSVNIQGNELRDAPVNRDTGLITSTDVNVDLRDLTMVAAGTGGDASARDYTSGGLLEVSGYLANIGHTIDEWAAVGGTIALQSGLVIAQPQAVLNIAGGGVTVQPGYVAQSYLIGTDGQLYNVNTAPAGLEYAGVYDGFTVSQPRWGVTQSFGNSIAVPSSIYETGYVYGRDAGVLKVDAPTTVLEAQVQAGVVNGTLQTATRPAVVTDSYALAQNAIALPGTLVIGGYDAADELLASPVTIADDIVPVADQIAVDGTVPANVAGTVQLSAAALDADQLGGLFVATAGHITVGAPLGLAPGGTLSLIGSRVEVDAGLTARGGAITLTDITVNNGAASVLPTKQNDGGVVIANGTAIDLRGLFTNAVRSPAGVSGEGLVNGGALRIDSAQKLLVGTGSVIDASSGAAVLAGAKTRGGAGGNVAVIGDDPQYSPVGVPATATVQVDAIFLDYGVNGGGTFALTAPRVLIGQDASLAANGVVLMPQMFSSGFSSYVINGFEGATVAPGTRLEVVEPVYSFLPVGSSSPVNAPSGEAPSQALPVILPATYEQDRATGRLTQRLGASFSLISNDRPGETDTGGGDLTIGAGASIDVDPGQSVRLEAYGQITDLGTIVAHGGNVSIINTENSVIPAGATAAMAQNLSIWIGQDALIDVSGQAVTAQDQFGRTYGTVSAGGTIQIAGMGATGADAVYETETDAYVLIRPGATLDASGASAGIDLDAGANGAYPGAAPLTDPVVDSSNGGSITFGSVTGILDEGIVRAAGGGIGAVGGTLSLILEVPVYGDEPVPDILRVARTITISQQTEAPPEDDAALQPGERLDHEQYGAGAISVAQVQAGGFGSLSLYARGAFIFDGDVDLSLGGSIGLAQGIISDSSPTASVRLAAPYVDISGYTQVVVPEGGYAPVIGGPAWHPYRGPTSASFTIAADLIDVSNQVLFGVDNFLTLPDSAFNRDYDLPGFGLVTFASGGDIRFGTGTLQTLGDLTLDAAQIYPTTGAVATIYAGYDPYRFMNKPIADIFDPNGTITVERSGTIDPAIPDSVGGTLNLYAGAIVQGGIIRAPEGTLDLGAVETQVPGDGNRGTVGSNNTTYTVDLLPGSVTSVSLDGATVPYGGTSDGVAYSYNGAPVGLFDPSVTLGGQMQTVEAGATLDLSGGGTLAGEGFITGRGGSTNLLATPLLQFDAQSGSVSTSSLAAAPVYAIVPGYGSAYAPVSPVESSGTYAAVGIGSQITIGAGVPGIAAGTYTLLPAYYALLPGAARVQINVGMRELQPGVTTVGAGTYETNATSSVANTGQSSAVPVEVLITNSAGVRLNSEFDEENYSTYELAQAAQYSTPRFTLPGDGKTLHLEYPFIAPATSAFSFDGMALFAGAAGYYGGQVTVGGEANSIGNIEIIADGATPTQGYTAIDATALDALHAPQLVLGGVLYRSNASPSQLNFRSDAANIAIRAGATLSAPQIFLEAGASFGAVSITVDAGAVLDTVGTGRPPYDSANGLYYDPAGATVLALSNGFLVFDTTAANYNELGTGAITVQDGAKLLTAGSLDFLTQQNVSLGSNATYGAKYLSLTLSNINLVSQTAEAEVAAGTLILPSGFVLTPDVLGALLKGDAADGVPALSVLSLTTTSSLNFAGAVSLDTVDAETGQSTLADLVIDTPAIYGVGGTGDVATIRTGTLFWNGLRSTEEIGTTPTYISTLPGGVVAHGPGTGGGTLAIDADNIVFGPGPDTEVDDQTTLNRVVEGFATVDLNASQSISSADRGTLSVYEMAGAAPGSTGTGGTLNIATPLLTGAAGSEESFIAGGALNLTAAGTPSAAVTGALGATLNLAGASVTDDSTILLNGGRLDIAASGGDLTIGSAARIDLAGASVTLIDQIERIGGGAVSLEAATGNVVADAGSVIDVSADGAAAGSLDVTALDGTTQLGGTLLGSSSAGQTSGSFDLRTGSLGDFAALDAALDAGGFRQSRAFELASGDLTVGGTLAAHQVSVDVDAGFLDVTGTIDAGGSTPGSIALSAGGDLTLAAGAVLNAAGTVLQTDSTGAAITSENRAEVQLATSGGTLLLGNATIDVASPDGVAPGTVDLTAPRSVIAGAETGDVAIDVLGSPALHTSIDIVGAGTIALYGSRTYTPTDSNGTIEQQADASIPGALSLDAISTDNAQFVTLAEGNTALAARIAGLSVYGSAFHLRPADLIQSSDASNGNLTVNGDLDLSALRYGPMAGSAAGAGEVGMLTLRAANTLTVNGSITDGFATPPDAANHTPDDKGWLLYAKNPLGQAVTLPVDLATTVTLENGSVFSTATSVALGYPITIASATLKAGVVIPSDVVTAAKYVVGAGGLTTTGTITGPGSRGMAGAAIATAGQVLAAGTVIPTGSTLGGGSVLPFQVQVANGTTWLAGSNLSLFASSTVRLDMPGNGALTLHGGAYIPAGSSLKFARGAASVAIRGTDAEKVQGLIYATAGLLPAGSMSWSIDLVGGADLASSDLLAVQPASSLGTQQTNGLDPAGSVVLSDMHYTLASKVPTTSFSVIRTGTGSLNLVAGGNVDMRSLFGVYTAGTQTSLGAADAAYQTARATAPDGTLLGRSYAAYNQVDAAYQAWYPDGGGDLLVSAQQDVLGDVVGTKSFSDVTITSDNVGNWLWRQGGAGLGQQTAWWINFGSYVRSLTSDGSVLDSSAAPVLTGFTGFGALGGGNVTVRAGGDAGEVNTLPEPGYSVSEGLVIAVASTGRVTSVQATDGVVTGGNTVLTGGGALTLDVAGTLNPAIESDMDDGTGGTLTDTRGDISVSAGQVGRIDLLYPDSSVTDPRAQSPFVATAAISNNGPIVVPGDGTVTIDTLRDLVLAGAGDPTRLAEQSLTAIVTADAPRGPMLVGATGFSLWTNTTGITLLSAGGNLTPETAQTDQGPPSNDEPSDYRFIYPGSLQAIAASGNFYYGYGTVLTGTASRGSPGYSLELAPDPIGQLALLAAGSIYANYYAIDMSGAADTLATVPNPYNPAYTDIPAGPTQAAVTTNILSTTGHIFSPGALFALEDDTVTGTLHADDTTPALIYAATGDIIDFQFGQVLIYAQATGQSPWYLAAKPARIIAGGDIIASGARPQVYPTGSPSGTFQTYQNLQEGSDSLTTGNLLLNLSGTDVSVVSAGQDILSSYFYIAGPGLLQVDAGRDIDNTGNNTKLQFGVLKSIGPVTQAGIVDKTPGASIAVLAGSADDSAGITDFAGLYFNAANQANLSLPLTDAANAGKVQQTYQAALLSWLQANYQYTGTSADALGYFSALPAADRAILVRSVFYTELTLSGRQYSDASSLFYRSYGRGRTAIATLFPTEDANGNAIAYDGNIAMDSGTVAGLYGPDGTTLAVVDAGISTLKGGNVQVLAPGGGLTLGTTGGAVPGGNSGIITYGSGDIDVYSLGSVLLGQSRIFTTLGGNILIWSATGDINAGRGAKTTAVAAPQTIDYSDDGQITLSPDAVTSGAGIATLTPIAGTVPGDVDLIAPEGTVDAGEAGIRVSGNLNIAALVVVNAANVQVGGKTSGNTAVAVTNVAAATAASAASGAAVNSSTETAAQKRQAVQQTPSVITVHILDDSDTSDSEQDNKKRLHAA